jgi:hypothetical protein
MRTLLDINQTFCCAWTEYARYRGPYDEGARPAGPSTCSPPRPRHQCHRTLDSRVQAMPGELVWIVGERRSAGEQKYYASNLPPETSLEALDATIMARWICEQAA